AQTLQVQHRQSGQIMVLKMNKLASNRGNMLREVQLMNRLSHPNILRFMGVCVHQGQLHALTEYINGGNLEQLLDSPVPLSWSMRVKLALNIAHGLYYLHSKGIFHRDLTSKNCLVRRETNGYTAVVGDFGLAEKIPTYSKDSKNEPLAVVGSPYWMAPEVLRGEFYDEKVDVFAYGIVLCETIARIPADPDYLPRTEDFGLDVATFRTMVEIDCPVTFLQLAFHCCSMEPTSRPSFLEITKCLEDILKHQMDIEGSRTGTTATLTGHTKHSPLHELGTQHLQLDQSISCNHSDTSHFKLPTLLLEPYSGARIKEASSRVNPFSQREDLKGGKIKLFATTSKSVISLTLNQLSSPVTPEPATEVQCDFSGPAATPNKCHSLPASPEVPHQESLALVLGSPHLTSDSQAPGLFPPPAWGQASALSPRAEERVNCGADSPELPQPPAPHANSTFIRTASSGTQCWQPQTQFPSGLLFNNNSVVASTPLHWGSRLEHSFSELSGMCTATAEQTECAAMLPGHSSSSALEQDKVLPCPSCCLSPFSFASVCHQPAPSPPHYQNLNCEAKSLLCHDQGHHQKAPGLVLAQPGLKLPEPQS
ncbi:TESK1 kinase, partial [Indicator maculatus]|nr:TESK1 kinase [Indicator maculatus]